MEKLRQSNIELCRITSIILVLLVHSDFAVFDYPQRLSDITFSLIFVESFSIIGVDVFVLITGYFSVEPNRKSVLNLLYTCFYYALLRVIYDLCIGNPINIQNVFFVSYSNWFVPSYLGLLLFAPALNVLCEKKSKKELGVCVGLLLIYELWWGFYPGYTPQVYNSFGGGYSILSFMILYLIARYIRLYGVPYFMVKWSGTIYILCSVFLSLLVLYILWMGNNVESTRFYVFKLFRYNNPLIIFAAICFFLTFVKWNLKYNHVINYLAKSVIGLLLMHTCNEVSLYLNAQYHFIYCHYSGVTLLLLWAVSISLTFIIGVLIDQGRIISYKYFSRSI